jgi:hypothetical protein
LPDCCFVGDALVGADDVVPDCDGSEGEDWLVEAPGLLDALAVGPVDALDVGLVVGSVVGSGVGVFVGATGWAAGLSPGADRPALPFQENAT